METRNLYRSSLESHGDNVRAQNELQSLSRHLLSGDTAGLESLEIVKLAGGELGGGLLAVGKWVGGGVLKALTSAMGGAGKALSKAFSDNEVLVRKVIEALDRKDSHNYTISEAVLKTITVDGDVETIKEDMKELLETLKAFSNHQKEVNDCLDKQLMTVGKLKGSLNTDLILKVVEEFKEIRHPAFKLSNKKEESYTSNALPGNRFLVFTQPSDGSVKYTMRNDTSNGSGSGELSLDKSEAKELLTLLGKINGVYKDIRNSYDSYLSFIKSWSDMVGSVSKGLDDSKAVSASVLSEAEKLLLGDPTTLAFYSGFTPRVVSYADRYINATVGVFA